MRVLLLTVAGLSSRFSSSVGYPCLKCLYHKNHIRESLLAGMLKRHDFFDRIVVVGGFQYKKLTDTLDHEFGELAYKLQVVENPEFERYGSGYSLYLGLKESSGLEYDELVFAEGDLFVDDESFSAVCASKKNVLTYNRLPIYANKSVVCYFDSNKKPHYIYDTAHGELKIEEPFWSIFNSGQIWKFRNGPLLKFLTDHLTAGERQGTNLVLVNQYFQSVEADEIEVIGLKEWMNCNTVEDFEQIGRTDQ